MGDLNVNLCGIELTNPIIPASGTFGYGYEFAELYDINCLGTFSFKGTTLEPRAGNPLPRIAEGNAGMLNAVGLQNPGVDAVISEVRQRRKRLLSKANRDTERQQTRPGRASAPAGRPRYDDEASARAEEGIIRVLLLDPALARDPTLPPPEAFTAPPLAHIYRSVLDRLRQGGEVTTATLGAALSSEEMSLLIRLQDEPLAAANSERALKDYIQKLYECKESKQVPGSPEDLLTLQRKLRERKGYEEA